MDELTIKFIANSKRSEEDKIRFTIHELGEEFISKTFNLWQNNKGVWEIHLDRRIWKDIFGYEPEGW